ncbi:hypothetical protein ACHWQZ_G006429, partial [Mnemiopsis leidyi]
MADDETNLVRSKGEEDIPAQYGSTTTQQPSIEEFDEKELNEIYEEIGFGPAQYLYWTLVGLVSYSDFAELTLMAVLLPMLRCEWGLSSAFETAIVLSMFASYAIFAMLFGRVADAYGRKSVLQWSILSLLLAAVGGALSPNKWVFFVTRLVTGACVGINLSCIACYSTEFAESKYRAYGILNFAISSSLGIAAVSGEAYLLISLIGWRWLIIIVSLPAVPALILLLVLPESPRYLCVSGQQERAMQAVRFMAKLNGKTLKENVRMICYEREDLGSYPILLNQKNKKSTIGLSFMYFNNIFVDYGFLVLIPLLLSSNYCGTATAPVHKCQPLTKDNLLELTVAGSAAVFGAIAAFIFAQVSGRLKPLRVSSAILVVAVASLFICINHIVIFVTVTTIKFFDTFANVIIWIMMPESFPTNIRSTAIGFINGWGKIGGVFGTGSVYLLFYISPHLLFGLFFL